MAKIRYMLGAAFIAAGLVFGLATTNLASATSPRNGEHKVTICHRTNSVTNPYVKINVDVAAVDGHGNNDHSHHTGPVATSQTVAQSLKDSKTKWGDIIPPVSGVTAGLNWTAEGQAIYHNNCKYVTTPTTPPANGGSGQNGGNGQTANGAVLGTTTQQVQAPVGAVKAGVGGAAGTASYLVPGFISSLAVLGYGVMRLRNIE